MASDRGLITDRTNSAQSTGPRSLAGTRLSRRNAITHRLTADHTLQPSEDPEEFRGLKCAMFFSLCPEGALENQLVERAASPNWRMRRTQIFEGTLFAWMAAHQKRNYEDDIAAQNEDRVEPHDPEIDAQAELADELKLSRAFEALSQHGYDKDPGWDRRGPIGTITIIERSHTGMLHQDATRPNQILYRKN